jgi:ubiquinone/menaquinone biosynthesis C-methylase UbiE
MNATLGVIAVVLVALVSLVVALRVVSRRHSTACPVWLSVLLETPYFEAVAGSATLIERAHVTPGMDVLDVGCGPGRVTVPVARHVGPTGRVVALDLQPGMLAKLQQKLDRHSVTNVEAVLGGAGDGRVPCETFDRTFLVTVLGEIVDRGAALREIHQALKPGGMLSVTEALPDPHYQSRRQVRALAEAVGFRVVESFGSWWAFTLNFAKE